MSESKQNQPASRKRGSAVKRELTKRLPGLLVGGAFVAVEVWFFVSLLRSKLVLTKYLVLIALALVLCGALVVFLCKNLKKNIRFIVGTLFAVLIAAGLLYGGKVVNQTRKTIEEFIVPETTVSDTVPDPTAAEYQPQMGIFVLESDEIQGIDELRGKVLGIENVFEREETDRTLAWLENKLGEKLEIIECVSFMEAINHLIQGNVQAVVLSPDHIHSAAEIMKEMGTDASFRQLTEFHVDHTVSAVTTVPDPTETLPESSEEETLIIDDDTTEDGQSTDSEGTDPGETVPEETTPEETTPVETLPEATTPAPTTAKPTQPAPPPSTASSISTPNASRIFTMYIQGIDSRNGLKYASRSDVNILAVVNMNSKQLLLITTPRDYYVPMSALGGARDKLTHNGWYGVWSVMDTMRMLYGVYPNYYFRCDFSGFKRVIDAMGGITVWSSKAFSAHGYDFVEGNNYMDGGKALVYARERYAFGGGDAIRGFHQMDIIKAVINKAMSTSVLSNLSGVISSLSGAFETNMSYDMIASMVRELQNGGWNITSYSVGGSGSTEWSPMLQGKAYVMWPDTNMVNYAQSMIRRIYNGEWVTP